MSNATINLLNKLKLDKKINMDNFILENCSYLCITGSYAYGTNEDNYSDVDIYGMTVPSKEIVFPHLTGYINGFGTSPKKFEQWQQHHVFDEESKKEYDFSIYNIVKYFDLLMNNNPNIIDSLFVPERCVLFKNSIAELLIENRRLFLNKLCFHRFTGYAYSMRHKMLTKNPVGKRKQLVEKYGYDVKFASHCIRLLNELEQILVTGDLVLDKDNEILKTIRRGEHTVDFISEICEIKLKKLEELYIKSSIPYSPNEDAIKQLLLNCLEMHYGKIDNYIKVDNTNTLILELESIIKKYK